jgi:hypothetical protein
LPEGPPIAGAPEVPREVAWPSPADVRAAYESAREREKAEKAEKKRAKARRKGHGHGHGGGD